MKKSLILLSILVLSLSIPLTSFADDDPCEHHRTWTKTWTDEFGQTTYKLQAPCKVYLNTAFTVTVAAQDAVWQNEFVGFGWKLTDNGATIGGGGFNWIETDPADTPGEAASSAS